MKGGGNLSRPGLITDGFGVGLKECGEAKWDRQNPEVRAVKGQYGVGTSFPISWPLNWGR